MARMTALKLIAVLIAALACMLAVEQHRVHTAQAHAAAVALRESNTVAERDSTRAVATTNHRVALLLGDSLHLVERRAMQLSQSRDAIDDALDRERRARYTLSMAVDSLTRSTVAVARHDSASDVRHARFVLRQPPYTIAADVDMSLRTDTARIDMRVALDPIHLDARMSCSPPNEDGIRTAAIAATTPVWATVRFDRLEQSPDLCASPALLRTQRGRRVEFERVVIGAGRITRWNGSGYWGWFIGTGITL
jgi:hypothetical protein